jgi:hypothetical protein
MTWVVVGVGFAGGVFAMIALWRQSDRPKDLGAVSHQWIAEHRMGSGPDSRQ